ncbi:MAG: hypothetical protein ABFQ95_01005 [Pseudomonadota bacterium]
MAAKKEIDENLNVALREVGNIKPWYDECVEAWVFSHEKYPVEYAGDSKEEVIENYPKYIKEFIKHRLNRNLSPIMENKTTGRGGYRPGSGRPTGTKKEPKQRIYAPEDVAFWLKDNENLALVRVLKGFLQVHSEIERPNQLKKVLREGIR